MLQELTHMDRITQLQNEIEQVSLSKPLMNVSFHVSETFFVLSLTVSVVVNNNVCEHPVSLYACQFRAGGRRVPNHEATESGEGRS